MIILPSTYPRWQKVIRGYWIKVGVKVEAVPVDFGVWFTLRNTLKRSELIGQASTNCKQDTRNDAVDFSSGYHTTGSHALFSKAKPDIEKAIDDAMTETDAAKRRKILEPAIKTAANSYTALMIASVPAMVALEPRLGIDFPNGANFISYVVDTAKHRK